MHLKKILGTATALAAALTLSSCVGSSSSNPTIDGITGPTVSFANDFVTVSLVFQNLSVDGGATIPIPKYPNSSLQIGPDFQSAGTLFSLTISASDFLGNKGVGLDPQTLPGGRPLPGVASGALPAIAVQVPQLANSVLYFGPTVMGVFVPFDKLNIAGTILTYRFYDSTNNPVGNISLVGSDQDEKNAGLLLLMDPSLLGINGEPARIATLQKYYRMGLR
jgi:hypothetical protein